MEAFSSGRSLDLALQLQAYGLGYPILEVMKPRQAVRPTAFGALSLLPFPFPFPSPSSKEKDPCPMPLKEPKKASTGSTERLKLNYRLHMKLNYHVMESKSTSLQ
jgi:hypothetical protein